MRPARQLIESIWEGFRNSEPDLIAVRSSLDELLKRHEKLERELRDLWLAELYQSDGARLWVRDAEKQGISVHEQLILLEQLRAGAVT